MKAFSHSFGSVRSRAKPETLVGMGVAGMELFSGKHQPCPRCGGKDTFRYDRNKSFFICNKSDTAGDLIALHSHLTFSPVWASCNEMGRYLGLSAEHVEPKPTVKNVKFKEWLAAEIGYTGDVKEDLTESEQKALDDALAEVKRAFFRIAGDAR